MREEREDAGTCFEAIFNKWGDRRMGSLGIAPPNPGILTSPVSCGVNSHRKSMINLKIREEAKARPGRFERAICGFDVRRSDYLADTSA